MLGFGHRIYTVDPRSQLLFEIAKNEGLAEDYIEIVKELKKELRELKGKPLPVNIDGAISANSLCV